MGTSDLQSYPDAPVRALSATAERLLIIGLDGATFDVLDPLMAEGRMPRLKEAVDSGRRAAVEARGDLSEKLDRSKAAYRAGIEAAREAGQIHEGKVSKGN